MRILLWATHLQTDLLALAYALDRADDVDLLIVVPDPNRFLAEPISRVMPLGAQILDRNHRATFRRARAFRADAVVADNHLPPAGLSRRLAYLWHGLGWKARSRKDLTHLYRQVEDITGLDPRDFNPRFLAQCYGEPDRHWRITEWKLHPESCVVTGMCFSDLLLHPPYERADLASDYQIDVAHHPVVLLSVTWHFGGAVAHTSVPHLAGIRERARDAIVLASRALPRLASDRITSHLPPPITWESERALLQGLLTTARDHGAHVLLCLHERKRYDPAYLHAVHELARQVGGVQVKHKNEHPDNLADLLVTDVMVSNLSSFITYFYVTGRPTVHLHPLPKGGHAPALRASLSLGRVRYRRPDPDEPLFMCDPEDNGGLLARDPEGAREALTRALEEPDCCQNAAADWLSRHVHPIDGATASPRLVQALRGLAEGG